MPERLVKLPLKADGYIWVRPSAVRLVRTEHNASSRSPWSGETHFLQLLDGLEYELMGKPDNTLAELLRA